MGGLNRYLIVLHSPLSTNRPNQSAEPVAEQQQAGWFQSCSDTEVSRAERVLCPTVRSSEQREVAKVSARRNVGQHRQRKDVEGVGFAGDQEEWGVEEEGGVVESIGDAALKLSPLKNILHLLLEVADSPLSSI
jgi:hypothetical protein